jgi:hypothetical protein
MSSTPLETADEAPLVGEATDGTRKFWTVRGGTPGNYYYVIYRQNLMTASENELTPAEKVVNILAPVVFKAQEKK